jgi:membrane peptidoglycan carboxypeptidase
VPDSSFAWSWLWRVALLAAVVFQSPSAHSQARPSQTGVAYVAIDLASGRIRDADQAAQLDRAVLPGSLIKVATLAAALEAGAISPRTGLLCTREVRVAGHSLTCTHPDLQRPLRPAEALAHSCNTFFTTVAARTPRSVLDRVLTDLGLPTTDASVPLAAAAVGIEGIRVAPRRLIDAIAKIAEEPSRLPWRAETLGWYARACAAPPRRAAPMRWPIGVFPRSRKPGP